jgi:hypothetical protein
LLKSMISRFCVTGLTAQLVRIKDRMRITMHDLFMMGIRLFLLAVYSMDETSVIGFVQFNILYHTVCNVV